MIGHAFVGTIETRLADNTLGLTIRRVICTNVTFALGHRTIEAEVACVGVGWGYAGKVDMGVRRSGEGTMGLRVRGQCR